MKVHYDFEKSVSETLNQIDNLITERAYKISGNEHTINGAIAAISLNDNSVILKIFLDKIHDYTFNQNIEKFGIFNEILLDCSGKKYSIEKNSVINFTNTLAEPQVLSLDLANFRTGIESDYENRTFRLVIPVDKEPDLSVMEVKSLKINQTITFAGLIEVTINQHQFHLFKHKNEDTGKSYLFIDSLQEHSLEEFGAISDAIISSFAFITGNLFLDEYYYLTFSKEKKTGKGDFDNVALRKKENSIITNKPLFNPTDFRYHLEKNNLSQKDELPIYMTLSCFSNLCSIVLKNSGFNRCCKLMIEGSSSKHILLQAAIYSLVLETMTNIIYSESEKEMNPIQDTKLAGIIRDKLKRIVSEYEEFIEDYGLQILTAKLDNINSPTNAKKLSKPFELYKIQLSKDDLQILGYRNKFLHGTSPYEEDEIHEKQTDLVYISSRLHFLVNALMLKYIGYRGHLINYPTIVQFNTKKELTEHLYKLI